MSVENDDCLLTHCMARGSSLSNNLIDIKDEHNRDEWKIIKNDLVSRPTLFLATS